MIGKWVVLYDYLCENEQGEGIHTWKLKKKKKMEVGKESYTEKMFS